MFAKDLIKGALYKDTEYLNALIYVGNEIDDKAYIRIPMYSFLVVRTGQFLRLSLDVSISFIEPI